MRNINFQTVGMENFGPYIEPMILEFPDDKLTLITGPNGIGKTLSLEAIPYTLFGSTSKGAKGDDLVNTRSGKNCHTWVTFQINNDNYEVHRYHKFKSLGNTVTISKNGEEPYKKGHREVVPEIERLICSSKSFSNTLMFGQKVKDFFTDLVDADKKDIFRQILNLEIYTEWYKIADLDLKDIKIRLQKILETIGIEQGILTEVTSQIEIINNKINDWYKEKEDKIEKYKKYIEDATRLLDGWKIKKKEVTDVADELKKVSDQIIDVDKQITHHLNEQNTQTMKLNNSCNTKISEIRDQASKAKDNVITLMREQGNIVLQKRNDTINKIDNLKNELNEKLNLAKTEIHGINVNQQMIQKDIDKLNNSLEMDDAECPTCLRAMDDGCKSHIRMIISRHKTNYQTYENRKTILNKEIIDLNTSIKIEDEKKIKADTEYKASKDLLDIEEKQKVKTVYDKLEETIQKVKDLAKVENEKIKNDYKKYINNLQVNMMVLQSEKKKLEESSEKVTEIDNAITTLTQNISNYEYQLNMTNNEKYDPSQLNEYKKRKIEIEYKLSTLKEEIESLKNDELISSFWKTAWSPTGIPSMLIDESIPFMNEKVAYYLEKLTNGRYIVSFDTLAATKAGEFRDKISVNVLDTYTRANSRIQLSGGQTRLVDIATILTLGDLQSSIQDISINILLFDEIFDSLDEENIGFVSKILSKLKIGKSIYLISHTQVEQLEADEILEYK